MDEYFGHALSSYDDGFLDDIDTNAEYAREADWHDEDEDVEPDWVKAQNEYMRRTYELKHFGYMGEDY